MTNFIPQQMVEITPASAEIDGSIDSVVQVTQERNSKSSSEPPQSEDLLRHSVNRRENAVDTIFSSS